MEIIGLIAASLTTAAYVPQVYKTWQEKSTKDISLSVYAVLLSGVLLWLVYGIYLKSIPIVLSNIIILFMLFLKLKCK